MGTKTIFNPLSGTFDTTDDNNDTALTGIPTAPTAAPLTSDTQIATTEYVDLAMAAAGGGWTISVEAFAFTAVVNTIHIITNAITATLPDPALGGQIVLKDDLGNGFYIAPFASELIDGAAGLFTVTGTRISLVLTSDGTNWQITSSYLGTTPVFNTLTVNDHIIMGQLVNAATGANANVLLTTPTPIVELNDPGLVSIDTITGVDQAAIYLYNATGVDVTLNDQTGSPSFEQILTGEGANVVLKAGYVAHLIYLGGFWVLLNIKSSSAGGLTVEEAITPLGSIIAIGTGPLGDGYASAGTETDTLIGGGLTIGEEYQINVSSPKNISLGSAAGLSDYVGSGVPPVTTVPAGTYSFIATSTWLYYSSASASLAEVKNLRTKAGVLGLGSALVSGQNIDWAISNTVFYQSISGTTTYTFSNVTDGKTISVIITNTGGSAATVAFPAGIKVKSGFVLSVPAGQANVYTFMRANGITYASFVDGLV